MTTITITAIDSPTIDAQGDGERYRLWRRRTGVWYVTRLDHDYGGRDRWTEVLLPSGWLLEEAFPVTPARARRLVAQVLARGAPGRVALADGLSPRAA